MTTDPFYAELQGLLEEKRLNHEALRNLQEAERGIDSKMALLRTRFHQEVIVPTCDAQSLSFNGESFRPFVVQDVYNGVYEIRTVSRPVVLPNIDDLALKLFRSTFSLRAYTPSRLVLVKDPLTGRYTVQVPKEGNASTQGQNGNTPAIP